MPTLWLVDREFDSKGLVRLTYATTDGTQIYTKELAEQRLYVRGGVTAATDVDEDVLETTEAADKDRFATEAQRMASEHDPDETI